MPVKLPRYREMVPTVQQPSGFGPVYDELRQKAQAVATTDPVEFLRLNKLMLEEASKCLNERR